MKVSVLQENLMKALSYIGRIVPARSTLPVLSNILLEAKNGRLGLSATNLEEGISCWVGAKVEREGAITVPARLLQDVIGSLRPGRIDMELTVRTQSLHLESGSSQANIKGIDAQDFPPLPTVQGPATLNLDPAMFREMINQVAVVAATDDSRPILTGVLLTMEPSRISLAAADGFRLAARSHEVNTALREKMEIIVPARALTELSRIMADHADKLEILIGPNNTQVMFRLECVNDVNDIELIAQTIDGQFPPYKQIIPRESQTRTVADAASILEAVKRAASFARDSANIIRLEIAPGTDLAPGHMIVRGQGDQIGDVSSELEATVEGQDIQIAFNAKYLTDALNAVDSPQVAIETNTPSSPGVIKPVADSDYIHIIMPMHTQR